MFKNPFSFNGRIRRSEYGISLIIYVLAASTVQLIFSAVGIDDPSILFFLFLIPVLWFMLAQGAKSCHDRGNAGWYQLIPFYGLWMLFADSDHGQNEYGPNPKGLGNLDEIDQIGSELSN